MKKLLILLTLFSPVHGYHIGDDAYTATLALAHHSAVLPSVLPELQSAAQQAFDGINESIQEVRSALEKKLLSKHTHVLAHRFLSFYADLRPSVLAQWHRDAATAQLKALKRLTEKIHRAGTKEKDLPSLACQNSMLIANLRLAPWLNPDSYTKKAVTSRHICVHSRPLYRGPTSLAPAAIAIAAVVTAAAFLGHWFATPAKNIETLAHATATADKELAEFKSYEGKRLAGIYLDGGTVDPTEPNAHRFRRHALFVLQQLLHDPATGLKDLSLEHRAALSVIPPVAHLTKLADKAKALQWLTTI